MKLQDQVISLELARKLKKLGVKQESIWYWIKIGEHWTLIDYLKVGNYKEHLYFAFTVAELGEMLPAYLENPEILTFTLDKSEKFWGVFFRDSSQKIYYYQEAKTLANTMAKMLIYLLENGLLKL